LGLNWNREVLSERCKSLTHPFIYQFSILDRIQSFDGKYATFIIRDLFILVRGNRYTRDLQQTAPSRSNEQKCSNRKMVDAPGKSFNISLMLA
jgi:hypothetical protein